MSVGTLTLKKTSNKNYRYSYSPLPQQDPDFASTILLIHADSGNALNNDVFVDSSSNNLPITVTGKPAQGTFSAYRYYNSSAYSASIHAGGMYVSGQGNYLDATSSNFAFGTGDFTIEAWVNYSGGQVGGGFGSLAQSIDSAGIRGISVGFNADGTITCRVGRAQAAQFVDCNSFSSYNIGSFVHVSLVRQSGTLTMWVDGYQENQVACTIDITATNFTIGRLYPSETTVFYKGFICGFRVVKGTALYVSESDFSITVPPTNVTNTALLLNFTNSAIIDNTKINNLITRSVNTSTSQARFGSSSILFTSLSYLEFPINYFNVSVFSFTVEAWVYPSAQVGTQTIYEGASDGATNAGKQMLLVISASGATSDLFLGSNKYSIASPNPPANQWSHVAWVRNAVANTFYCYLNGALVSSISTTGSLNVGGTTFLPRFGLSGTNTNPFTGYMDEIRISANTSGSTRYSGSSFTLPGTQFPNY